MVGLSQVAAGPGWWPESWRDWGRALGLLALLLLPGIRPARAQSVTVTSGAADRSVIIIQQSVNVNQTQQVVRLGPSAYPSVWPVAATRRPAWGGRRPAAGQAGRWPGKSLARRPVGRRPAGNKPRARPATPFPFLAQRPAYNYAWRPVSRRQPSPVAPWAQPVPVAPAPAASHPPGKVQSGGNGAFETQEVNLISQYRQQNGLGALTIDPNFSAIALGHSQDMANRHNMDHNGFDQRFAQAQQYGATRCVENVAWNYNDPQSLFSAWQNSPEHNANMLDNAIRRAGVAIVNGYSTFFACN